MTESVTAFIGIGSNLGDSEQTIRAAIADLTQDSAVTNLSCSSVYRSLPMGPQSQNDYFNAVIQLETHLAPIALLDLCQSIENAHGRVRLGERWGPRTLDLDLLLYGNKAIDLPRLKVPHYGMLERNFVLVPLFELAPDVLWPSGEKIKTLVPKLTNQGLWKIA